VKECAYCGSVVAVTKDHIPPKGIFSPPRPNNLISVPACFKCHGAETAKDDEYFRLSLQVRMEVSEHPDAIKLRPALLRSLQMPEKVGMLKSFLRSIVPCELTTPSGVFIKNHFAHQADTGRLNKVVSRIVRGLFYHHKGHIVPRGYDVLTCSKEHFDKSEALKRLWTETVIAPLLAQPCVTIGNGVFSYRFGFDSKDPDATYWILTFYENSSFLGTTIL
jgi:hypothetical protein